MTRIVITHYSSTLPKSKPSLVVRLTVALMHAGKSLTCLGSRPDYSIPCITSFENVETTSLVDDFSCGRLSSSSIAQYFGNGFGLFTLGHFNKGENLAKIDSLIFKNQ